MMTSSIPGITERVCFISSSSSGLPFPDGIFMRTRPGTWCATCSFTLVITDPRSALRMERSIATDIAASMESCHCQPQLNRYTFERQTRSQHRPHTGPSGRYAVHLYQAQAAERDLPARAPFAPSASSARTSATMSLTCSWASANASFDFCASLKVPRTVDLNTGASELASLGGYFGAAIAAAPSTGPGNNPASNSAAPAATTTTVARVLLIPPFSWS